MNTYISAIFPWPLDFAPQGFALCNGQLLDKDKYDALFHLIGFTFGGDGVKKFAVPNLVGQVPVGAGQLLTLGDTRGANTVTLTTQTVPKHTHTHNAYSEAGNTSAPNGNLLANTGADKLYTTLKPTAILDGKAVGRDGVATPVSIQQPSFKLNYIIAIEGLYPSPA